MKHSALRGLLKTWNEGWFAAIKEMAAARLSVPAGASDDDAVREANLADDYRCCCGKFNGDELFPDEIRHSPSGVSIAVGAILDDQSHPEADLPVIVAVGINYWQFRNSATPWVQASWRTTRMRPALDTAMEPLVAEG